jgi:hypothetical protein
MSPGEVTAPEPSAEAEVDAIGEADRLPLRLEGEDHGDGVKEFLLGDSRFGRQPDRRGRRVSAKEKPTSVSAAQSLLLMIGLSISVRPAHGQLVCDLTVDSATITAFDR